MAAPFVPIPESISWVRGIGPWGAAVGAPTPDDPWSRTKGGMLDESYTLPEAEGSVRDSWVERCISPTLLGYEILEEREKFTVYKILVTGGEGDSWVIFRRYTDFCRLSDKLKELFPSFDLALPPKRWFKDNYDEEFLEQRQTGLQTFLQNLMSHKDIVSSEAVKRFLCLVDQKSPFDSLDESRAFCETLEETNHRLQLELSENQSEVDTLRKTLKEKESHISLLVKKVKNLSASTATSTNTQRGGDADVNGFKQQHTDGDEGVDDDRHFSVTEVDKETIYGSR